MKECEPLVETEKERDARRDGTLLMTEYKWASLSDSQRNVYTTGFLETTSFFMYSHYPRNDEALRVFSDWTACAEQTASKQWTPLAWYIKGELSRTAASQFFEIASIVCKDTMGKGERGWRPVRLTSKNAWTSLSLQDKAIYVMAYVETAYELLSRAKQDQNIRKLSICVASQGIEGIMSALEKTPVEWKEPLPWSIASAMGKACR